MPFVAEKVKKTSVFMPETGEIVMVSLSTGSIDDLSLDPRGTGNDRLLKEVLTIQPTSREGTSGPPEASD